MDGFEILKAMKADKEVKNIPVILLTNLSQKDEVKKGLDLGAKDYLIKAHFMPSEVVKKIKETLGE
jgi:DNA-binding response OmpR family regulator